MRQGTAVAENALHLTLFPLLHRVDPALYYHICVRSGLRESGFALSWITAWFASDVGDLAVGSRLVDVFLVSHPLMPIYCVVALLVSQRRRLLRCDASLKSIYANLQSLNLMASLTMSDNQTTCDTAMKQTEEIIALALQFIKRMPPQLLIKVSREDSTSRNYRLSAIAMLSTTGSPSWCTNDSCPTEWEVMKRAKAMREGRVHLEPHKPSAHSKNLHRYHRAFSAAAHQPSTGERGEFRFISCCIALVAISYLLLASMNIWSNTMIGVVPSGQDVSASPREPAIAAFSFHNEDMQNFHRNTSLISKDVSDLLDDGKSSVVVVLLHSQSKPSRGERSVDRYTLTDTEQDFEHHVLKPLHSFCALLLNKARDSVATVLRRFKPQRNLLVVSAALGKHQQVYSFLGTKIDTSIQGNEDQRIIRNATEKESLQSSHSSTAIVVSPSQGEKSSNRIRNLRLQVKQKIEGLKRGVKKGKVALMVLLRFGIRVTSTNFEPFLNDSLMHGF